MRRALTDADIDAWAHYEVASARAADQYEATPIMHCNNGRTPKCVRCHGDIVDPGLCRTCRRAS